MGPEAPAIIALSHTTGERKGRARLNSFLSKGDFQQLPHIGLSTWSYAHLIAQRLGSFVFTWVAMCLAKNESSVAEKRTMYRQLAVLLQVPTISYIAQWQQ